MPQRAALDAPYCPHVSALFSPDAVAFISAHAIPLWSTDWAPQSATLELPLVNTELESFCTAHVAANESADCGPDVADRAALGHAFDAANCSPVETAIGEAQSAAIWATHNFSQCSADGGAHEAANRSPLAPAVVDSIWYSVCPAGWPAVWPAFSAAFPPTLEATHFAALSEP